MVKRGNEFTTSRSQWRTSRANLPFDAICAWAGVYSFSGALRVEMPEHTEPENGVHYRFGQVHAKQGTAQLAHVLVSRVPLKFVLLFAFVGLRAGQCYSVQNYETASHSASPIFVFMGPCTDPPHHAWPRLKDLVRFPMRQICSSLYGRRPFSHFVLSRSTSCSTSCSALGEGDCPVALSPGLVCSCLPRWRR